MERTITLFVERSRQLLADFSLQAQRDGAAQRRFIADFTRMIEDFLDTLRDQGIAVGAQLAGHLIECCTQLRRLADALDPQPQDRAATAQVEALQRRLARCVAAPAGAAAEQQARAHKS